MPICADCKFFRMPSLAHIDAHEFSRCVHPRLLSSVTGTLRKVYCETQRRFSHADSCGEEAKFFEAADGTPELIEHFDPLTIGQFGVR